YWNSEWAYPVAALDDTPRSPEHAQRLHARLDAWLAGHELPFELDAADGMRARLARQREALHRARAYVVYDSLARVAGDDDYRVAEFLFDGVNGVRNELLIETGYFVPGDRGVELLEALVARGVRVRVLTNSLATTDVAAAHA